MVDGRLRFSGEFRWGRWRLDFSGRTLVMGILNVTPDSFSDGGEYFDRGRAVAHALKMVKDGADMIDIGGQSTRPGSEPVGIDTECDRVLPVISELAGQIDVPISIDTTQAAVAEAALDAGAGMINDISALRFDDQMAALVADRVIPVILMHMQGTPRTMQIDPHYDDVVGEVKAFLEERLSYAETRGVARSMTIVDVGIGFGKRLEHNLALLGRMDAFFDLGVPVLVGHSRKRFLGDLLALEVTDRDAATLAVSTHLAGKAVHILRVHAVHATRQTVELVHHLTSQNPRPA